MKTRSSLSIAAVLAACLFAPAVANAVDSWHQEKLKFVYPLGNGDFVLGFQSNSPSCASTSNPQYFYVSAGAYGVTAEGVKAMLATALMALATEKSIAIAFDGTSPYCYINRFSVQN
ncbi:MAG TPA: hypothetical protein VFU13_15355 [Steroidobacteraceae bacterium]|nr:hypothetical protein [Steroidobacteraceae bacterium]